MHILTTNHINHMIGRGTEVPCEEDLRGLPRLDVPVPGADKGEEGDDDGR